MLLTLDDFQLCPAPQHTGGGMMCICKSFPQTFPGVRLSECLRGARRDKTIQRVRCSGVFVQAYQPCARSDSEKRQLLAIALMRSQDIMHMEDDGIENEEEIMTSWCTLSSQSQSGEGCTRIQNDALKLCYNSGFEPILIMELLK